MGLGRSASVANNTLKMSMQDLHVRLGHLNENDIKLLLRNKLINGITADINEKLPLCEVCKLSKLKKLPFQSSKTKHTRIGEPVSSDIVGPIDFDKFDSNLEQKLTPYKYFVTFTDHYSRYITVYPLHSKSASEVLSKYKDYSNTIRNKTQRPISTFRSDNGTEFVNHSFTNYLKSEGTVRELTIRYTPEQNGVSERLNGP